MATVTYPDKDVITFIENYTVPVQVPYNEEPLASDFGVKQTPTIVTLDADGEEHHRTVGFLAPEELIPALLLGIAKVYFDADELDKALPLLEKIIADFSKSDATPEAIYLQGVSKYKKMHDPQHLKRAYEKLSTAFPASEWTKKASPYRLL